MEICTSLQSYLLRGRGSILRGLVETESVFTFVLQDIVAGGEPGEISGKRCLLVLLTVEPPSSLLMTDDRMRHIVFQLKTRL